MQPRVHTRRTDSARTAARMPPRKRARAAAAAASSSQFSPAIRVETAETVGELNQRLNKPSDPMQVEQLFWASQVDGAVDFIDFLQRESTQAYFRMDSHLAA